MQYIKFISLTFFNGQGFYAACDQASGKSLRGDPGESIPGHSGDYEEQLGDDAGLLPEQVRTGTAVGWGTD